ncbi:hypothetical protein C0992_010802 [Termitomyces sp. T32_za158]|nr:hypothetical protein C0992_010802 [Termitomyces sp. T32_za158]
MERDENYVPYLRSEYNLPTEKQATKFDYAEVFEETPIWTLAHNGPQITKAIKAVLKDDYNYDSTPTWYALYRSFSQCLFVEEEGDIIFYKNRQGAAAREVAQGVVKRIKEDGWNGNVQDSSIEFPRLD